LDTFQIREVIERSVRVQIENAYGTMIVDSVKKDNSWPDQLQAYTSYYTLDDYNRFPTMKDHFVEYIVGARVRKDKFVISHGNSNNFNQPQLVLVDGVPTPDSIILAYSPYKIKSIGVINNRYYLGAAVFDGVLNFETFDGGLGDLRLNENVIKKSIVGISAQKAYLFPDYTEDTYGRIPDKRDQLYWNPDFRPANEINSIDFYTSDIPGIYKVVVEGFTTEGQAISLVKYFEVE